MSTPDPIGRDLAETVAIPLAQGPKEEPSTALKIFRGLFSIHSGQPLVISEEQEKADFPNEQSDRTHQIGQVLKAYREAGKDLLSKKYPDLREIAPAHMRTACDCLAIICDDGIVVRYDRHNGNDPKIRVGFLEESIESVNTVSAVAPKFSEGFVHCPIDPTTPQLEPPGPRLQLYTTNHATGERTSIVDTQIFIVVPWGEVRQQIPAPGRPMPLVSITNELDLHVVGAIDIVGATGKEMERDVTVNATDEAHAARIIDRVGQIPGLTVVNYSDRTFLRHLGGKIEVRSKIPVKTRDDLTMAYTPGVARVSMAIHADPTKAFNLTIKGNTVAIVSDGSAVLGLGDIGPEAAMPVMEGKALLFKEFGGVDAFPLCLATKSADEIVRVCELIAPTFGGINLEDISAPRCFEIEERLKASLDIPVFHDDQHGTAIVVLAALFNALKIVGKELAGARVLISGVGAAGVACARMLLDAGVGEVIGVDTSGAIYEGRTENMSTVKREYARLTNRRRLRGRLSDVIAGADIFLGVSQPGVITAGDVERMAKERILFALANPSPEIDWEVAAPHVRVMATGRSDYPNQINNVLAFPGVFRGALDCRAREINHEMKVAAARAISELVGPDELSEEHIIPSVFDRRVAPAVAEAIVAAAERTSVARRHRSGTTVDEPDLAPV